MGFNLGNALKYIWRCDLKHNAIEDLRKAIFYIERELTLRENKPNLTTKKNRRSKMTTKVNYSEMVQALAKSGELIIKDLNSSTAHNLHMAVGVAGEAGELLDAIKKSAIYNKPLDTINVIEELGDLEFYMEGLRQNLNINREETLQANIDKLAKRYEGFKYSNQAAQDRADKPEEK